MKAQPAFFRRLRDLLRPFRSPGATAPAVDFEELEKHLGHRFRNPDLLRHALTHRSHAFTSEADRFDSNERLEFLGDAVLGFLVNEHLFHDFPRTSEGELTKMKSLLVCRRVLVQSAQRLDLPRYLLVSENASQAGVETRESVLADGVEAVIAAVYLDGGMEAARRMVNRVILEDKEEILEDEDHINYKSLLQEWIQARYKTPPRYKVSSTSGPDHAKSFSVEVTYRGRTLGRGRGTSKRAAEQEAARKALERLESKPRLLDR
jgi:ribonuclease-3